MGTGLLAKAAAETSAALTVVVGFVMSIAFLVYVLADAPGLRRWVVGQASAEHRPVVERTLDQGWTTLSGYVRGTIVVAVFDTVFIGIAVFALGLPIPGTLLALTFFAAFIPIVGAWVAGLIVVLVALAFQPGVFQADVWGRANPRLGSVLEQVRGMMALPPVTDADAIERGGYVAAIQAAKERYGAL